MPESLLFQPVLERPDLVPQTVLSAVQKWQGQTPVHKITVAEIDPALCGGEDLCAHYGVDPSQGANCLVVEARRGENKTYCACLAPVGAKMDLGGAFRRHVKARVVSMAPLEFVLAESGMEHGSVTPIGLPPLWRVFLDASLSAVDLLIIGGGLKKSKLQIPVAALLEMPNVEVLDGLVKAG